MFNLVQGEAVAADLVEETVKKMKDLFHGALKTKLDHPMDHHGIINVNPEREALLLTFQGGEIEFFQFAREFLVALEEIRASDGFITHPSSVHVDEPSLQIGHGQRQSDVKGLFKHDPGRDPAVENDG